MIAIKEMSMPKDCDNCWFSYIQSLQRGTSKTYCTMELTKRMYQTLKENDSNKYIRPVYDMNGEVILYEVYSENCTKCIERWRVVKDDECKH